MSARAIDRDTPQGRGVESNRTKEFHFSDREFNQVRRLVSEHTGIVLSDAKKEMIYSRLVRRLRQLNLDGFKDYIDLLTSAGNDELVNFTNAVTTNLTSFFREPHHFEYLSHTLLPKLMRARQAERRLRVWSAGCSTGEEPYSLAMTIRESIPEASGWDVKILATDLDSNVVAKAQSGVYGLDRVADIPAPRLKRWFMRGRGEQADLVRVKPELRNMISFRQLNLLREWPMRGPFDVIFCRNVVIYFDKPTQQILFERYADIMAPDAQLFIGHSETLYNVTDRFVLLGQTIYSRVK